MLALARSGGRGLFVLYCIVLYADADMTCFLILLPRLPLLTSPPPHLSLHPLFPLPHHPPCRGPQTPETPPTPAP